MGAVVTHLPASGIRPRVAPARESILAGYDLPYLSPSAVRILTLAFLVFIVFETLEAPLRFAFGLVGASWLIYGRDLAVVGALAVLACQQAWRRRLQGAFLVFGIGLAFHGAIAFMQCRVLIAVLISMKMLLNPLFGAVFLPILLRRRRSIAWLLALLWLITAVGVIADHQGINMPWKGMSASVGDYTVVVNKKWNFEGEDRVGGFARDSVGAGMLAAFFGIYALIFARSVLFRILSTAATLAIIYLTTSKGGVLAFGLVALAALLPMRRSQALAKLVLGVTFLLMMLLPVVLPNYLMPSSPAVLASLFDRVSRVWPTAWHTIGEHSWIFGAGMGNIGAGEQFQRFEVNDPGDNLFVLAYGFFGVFSVIYLLLPMLAAIHLRTPVDAIGRYALAMLTYIFAYGIVVNILEGPVAAFMLGIALQALALRRIAPDRPPRPGETEPALPRLTDVVGSAVVRRA